MNNNKSRIDISSVDSTKLPHKDRLTEIKKTWYKFSLNKMSVVGLVIIVLVVFLAVFYKFIVPYPEDIGATVKFSEALQAPSAEHILGTDATGRDLFSRIIYAFRGALTMGVGCLALVVPIGGILGLIAGYWNGKFISNFIMRLSDVFLALPALILVMCVSSIMEPSMTNAMLALSVSWWPWYTRLVYGIVVSTRNETYIRSAEVLGASRAHILFKEILPNTLSPILTKVTLDMGWAIMAGATLSYVGMGEQPPTPSLGSMVSSGVNFLPDQWWMSVFPALAIMIIVLGFNLAGDGIKDMLSNEE
ncbi:MAG: ABC transporter permease [Firmicutes bacterium]|nr:ABC transporter permease [Bacillota bacterium]